MMILYLDNNNTAFVLGLYFRRDKSTGYYLSSKKIGDKRIRLHRFMWEYFNSKIPQGYEVHHKNHNKEDNEIGNLELLPIDEHHKRHSEELTAEQRKDRGLRLIEKAMPKAKEWHKSESGKNWHKQHYEQTKAKLHRKAEFVCQQCGAKFIATNTGHSKFCSNNCKSAYRRQSGIDNIERECAICGEKFITNKYSKAKYCKEHRRKSHKA